MFVHILIKYEFTDTKGVIRILNRRRTDNTMTKRERTKGQTTIYKTLHRKEVSSDTNSTKIRG
jgi:hypothetical protein